MSGSPARERLAIWGVAAVVTMLILSPLWQSGYVLSYDMVFVPRQPLRWDLLVSADTVPRAVPLDAAVSLVSTLIPGWLLQRLVLAGIILASVTGAAKLVPAQRLATRLIAGVCYGWTPFLAERLLIGQWGLLIAYAALPWLIIAARRYAVGGSLAPLVLSAGLSALTPTGGLIAAAVCIAFLPKKPLVYFVLLLLNSPWIVASIVTTASIRSDPAGVAAFAVRAENEAGALLTLLGTGGIWNRETTPGSRSALLVTAVTVMMAACAVYGYRKLHLRRLTIVAAGGFVIALASTVPWGQAALEWLVVHVPGAGVLRDAHKFVLPYALLLALCVALGVERLANGEKVRLVLVGALVTPIIAMPDLIYGGLGALRPVTYPSEWDTVANIVHDGEVLSLPLSEYRAYPWNRYRVVIDVAPRYLPVPVLTDDRLVVGDLIVRGENPRIQEIADKPLRDSGIRWILVQGEGVSAEALSGLVPRHTGRFLALYENPNPSQIGACATEAVTVRQGKVGDWPVIVAELAALMVLIVAMCTMACNKFR